MIIRTEALRKEYDSVVAVNDVSLEISEGEIYALIGPNGAGKTTLMKMICGLTEPTAGRVLVNGYDVWEHNLDANAYMAFLPDFFGLYGELTVWEYLDFFANAYKLPAASIPARIRFVLELVSLLDKKDARCKQLSRGMQQRLGIAKSIIHAPKLLVLDEPAAGLDPNARVELSRLLVQLQRAGVTILISSHILSELADFSTAVGIMDKGKLVRSGTIAKMLRDEHIEQRILIEYKGTLGPLERYLRGLRSVTSFEQLAVNKVVFGFKGSDDDLIALHRLIMAKKYPVVSFGKQEQGIADIFAKVTGR